MFSADFIVGIAQLDNCYNHRTVPKLTPSPYAVPGIREANIKTVKENYGKGTANKKELIGRTAGREFGHNQILQTCATLSQIKTN